MPAETKIDHNDQLIRTTWSGDATDDELFHVINSYLQEIKSKPDYNLYNEIVDFRDVGKINISTMGLEQISKVAVSSEQPEISTKLAFIVKSDLAYGMIRMYTSYRNLISKGNKQIKVFKNESDAHQWIKSAV